MVDELLTVLQFASEKLALPVGASVLTTLGTAKVIRHRNTAGEIADHDRRASELAEDLNRWVHDRDRQAKIRMNSLAQRARKMGVERGGTMAQARGKVYSIVLHEYRDAGSAKQREFDRLVGAEGRAHARRRRRTSRPSPSLHLSESSFEIVTGWRQLSAEDVSRAELEPRLAELEPVRGVARTPGSGAAPPGSLAA